MGWLYLLGALVFPPVFMLWRPRTPVVPARLRLRFAASVVVVWMLIMLWSVRSSITDGEVTESEGFSATDETSVFSAEAPAESTLILVLGWVPGLVYAGLLSLARKALEPQQSNIIEAVEWRDAE